MLSQVSSVFLQIIQDRIPKWFSRLGRMLSGRAGVVWLAALTTANALAQEVISRGENKEGTILAGQSNALTFPAAVGDRVILQIAKLSGGAGFTPLIQLFAPDGTRLGVKSGALAARLDIQANVQGSYSVLVSDINQTGTGTYRLQLVQLPGAVAVPANDEGGTLANGENQKGNIDVGDLDPWTFTANARDRIVLQVAKVAGGAGFTPMIELFGPDGARLAFSADAVAARVDVQAAVSGTYTIVVSDASPSGSGGYELRLAQVPGDFTVPAGDNGGALPEATDKEGEITLGDLDLWTFVSNPGSKMGVQLTKLSGGAGFAPKVEVFAPTGERKALDQDASAPALEFATEIGGAYTVLVSDGNRTGAGTYRLRATGTSLAPATGIVLTNGGTYLGDISVARADDRYTFTASTGENIVLRVGETTAGSRLVPQLRLFDPSGTLLGSSATPVGAEVAVRATNSGIFGVSVRDNNAGVNTGGYRLSFVKTGHPLLISPSDEGGTLTNGTSHVGSIDTGDVDAWSFTANTGDSMVVRMGELTSTLVPQLRLYDPTGALLDTSATPIGAEVAARATNSGTFLLIVGDQTANWAGTGNYRLTLAKTGSPLAISPSDEGGALTNGASYVSSLETGDIDAWAIPANAGESIVLRMGEITSTLTPELRLYDPSGVLLNSIATVAAAEVTVRATNSGTFLLLAGDRTANWAGAGNYRLTMAKTGSPLAISPSDEGGALTNGTTFIGSIETGDIDSWTINASAGESIVARMGEMAPALTPQLRLFDPSGALLETSATAVAAEVSVRATNSGAFLLVAGDQTANWSGTGNYRLSLVKTGSPIVISAGQEGGPLSGEDAYDGTLEIGALDAWSFAACAGDNIVLNVRELVTGSTLTPWIRLFSRDGVELRSLAGPASAEFTVAAPASGTYTVVIGDRTANFAGSGTYRLTAKGLAHALKFCLPRSPVVGFTPTIIGGLPSGAFTLLMSTNAAAPLSQWTTTLTNQFDAFGVFTLTNVFDRNDPQRFFQLRTP